MPMKPRTMVERCFRNVFPELGNINSSNEINSRDSVVNLLREPAPVLSNKLLAAALCLKDEVVHATWPPTRWRKKDESVYTGLLGTAFLCFRAYRMTGNVSDVVLCRDIVKDSHSFLDTMRQCPTFLCGPPGLFALGAVSANCLGDEQERDFYLKLLLEVASGDCSLIVADTPYELLNGRAGYLWAVLFVNQHLGYEAIPITAVMHIIHGILHQGRAEGASSCPLIYHWHKKAYWGAAHGLSGIIHCLLHFPIKEEDTEIIKTTLKHMIYNRFSESKNFPSCEGSIEDRLVQWCHGAPGVVLTLCKAAEVLPSEKIFREAAIESGDVVWHRGLLRKVGLCHGISGNAYTFLALHKLTKEQHHLHRANAFGCFLLVNSRDLIASGELHGGDRPYSLFEGLAGMACLWLDLVKPLAAKFPAFQI